MTNSFYVVMLKTPDGKGQRLLPRSGCDGMGAILYESEIAARKMQSFWSKHTDTGEIATVEHVKLEQYKGTDNDK